MSEKDTDYKALAKLIVNHPVGAVTLPNRTRVPVACKQAAEDRARWEKEKRSASYDKLEQHRPEPLPGGFGAWSPLKSECVSCVGSLQCFARKTGTPLEEIMAALEKAEGKPASSYVRSDVPDKGKGGKTTRRLVTKTTRTTGEQQANRRRK